ncbi:MAG: FlgD immunoglobulin-like domain containing protein [Bacteroidia bacterium]
MTASKTVLLWIRSILLSTLALFFITLSWGQPTALHDSISIRKVMDIGSSTATRIDIDPATNELYYATVSGDIFKVNISAGNATKVFDTGDHGLDEVYGFEIGGSGNIYLVSMVNGAANNIAMVKKYDGAVWTTMVTANYPRSSRDHRFNAVIETPDQQHILVNSGARTDHGELKSNGQRENAFTAKLLKFPVDTANLTLQDDEVFMEDFIFATGLRNTYDIEYDSTGLLFGLDQADQSDRQEELNWIQEGKHYGFPWMIGPNENLMQYPNYNPPASDPLVTSVNMESTFHNDPNFPPKPGVPLMSPVMSHGPDQDLFRDTVDAQIKDASDINRKMGTFTPHSSPVGLTFDTKNALPQEFKGKAFSLSWSNTNDRKFKPFNQIGEDLLMIDLEKVGNNYEANITRIALGFNHPVDAAILGDKMYVIEHADNGVLWEVDFGTENTTGFSSQNLTEESGLKIFPNAFHDQVSISLTIEKTGEGFVRIYSLEGKLIHTLWEGTYLQPTQLTWDGTTEDGRKVPNGIYLVEASVNGKRTYARVIKSD